MNDERKITMILMNDFKAESSLLRKAMLGAAKRVINSGWYILGDEVIHFEKQWAAACGLRHGVGVGNGMDAIEIALRALHIGKGDEVITTPMTAFATVLAILRAGATPVLADIDSDTALLSLKSVESCFSARTKAVLLVHIYGQVRAMDAWKKICEKHCVYLIEDCAQAHSATWQGKVVGSFGVAGAYSFYPTKNLGALGDAGILVTDDSLLAERATCLRNYGQSARYYHPDLGMNSRLDEIQAAMLAERLKWLPEFSERRRRIAAMYQAHIHHTAVRPLAAPEEAAAHSYHLYVVRCERRDELQTHLQTRKIQSLIHYPIPVHHQQPCKKIRRSPRGLSHAEAHARICLSLPCHPQMTDKDVEQVIDGVNSFASK
jgi:dTDP-4-amino-4,6-dideoxygalactose transaminase